MASDSTAEQAPPEVHHYSHVAEVPWDIQKYAPSTVLARTIFSNRLLATGDRDTTSSTGMTKGFG